MFVSVGQVDKVSECGGVVCGGVEGGCLISVLFSSLTVSCRYHIFFPTHDRAKVRRTDRLKIMTSIYHLHLSTHPKWKME